MCPREKSQRCGAEASGSPLQRMPHLLAIRIRSRMPGTRRAPPEDLLAQAVAVDVGVVEVRVTGLVRREDAGMPAASIAGVRRADPSCRRRACSRRPGALRRAGSFQGSAGSRGLRSSCGSAQQRPLGPVRSNVTPPAVAACSCAKYAPGASAAAPHIKRAEGDDVAPRGVRRRRPGGPPRGRARRTRRSTRAAAGSVNSSAVAPVNGSDARTRKRNPALDRRHVDRRRILPQGRHRHGNLEVLRSAPSPAGERGAASCTRCACPGTRPPRTCSRAAPGRARRSAAR